MGTWAASPALPLTGYPEFKNQTLREIVRVSVAGTALRVTFSNLLGTEQLQIAEAHVAISDSGSSIVPATDRTLTFGGSPSCLVNPGESLTSDTLEMNIPALTEVAVSLYLPAQTSNPTVHPIALETTYVSSGNHAGDTKLAEGATVTSWSFLTNMDVRTVEPNDAIVAIGDSITDGFNSTLDANHRWTDILANRLTAQKREGTAVLNAGLSGNRVLHDAPEDRLWYGPAALNRFDRDVLGQAGVKYVIVLEGINDIALPGYFAPESDQVTSSQITAGFLDLIERAHSHGIRIYGGTLTPFDDAVGFSAAKEMEREDVNQWIRTSNSFDAVVDFDEVLRDPNHPTRLLPQYDSGDHIHPNDAGYDAMANAVALDLFE